MPIREEAQTMPDGIRGWSKWVLQVWFITFVLLPLLRIVVKLHEFREAANAFIRAR